MAKNNIEADPTLKTLSKTDLAEKCAKFGMKKSLGKLEMITKLNEINGMIYTRGL